MEIGKVALHMRTCLYSFEKMSANLAYPIFPEHHALLLLQVKVLSPPQQVKVLSLSPPHHDNVTDKTITQGCKTTSPLLSSLPGHHSPPEEMERREGKRFLFPKK
jgi:hypothetical protein